MENQPNQEPSTTNEVTQKLAYSVMEAAQLTGLSQNTIRSLIEYKKIPAVKLGRRILIPRAALEKMFSIETDAPLPKK